MLLPLSTFKRLRFCACLSSGMQFYKIRKIHRKYLKHRISYYTLFVYLVPIIREWQYMDLGLFKGQLDWISTLTMTSPVFDSVYLQFLLVLCWRLAYAAGTGNSKYGTPQNESTFSVLVIIIIASSCDNLIWGMNEFYSKTIDQQW